MQLASLLGPAVTAAVVSAIVAVLGIVISARTSRAAHQERLHFEKDQAERKTNAEISLAERRFEADVVLAERRIELEQKLASWKHRADLAEDALADFYQARDIVQTARAPAGFLGEGSSRQRASWETLEDSTRLDLYFRVLERLNGSHQFFALMFAKQHKLVAAFGSEAASAYHELSAIRGELILSVQMLIENYKDRHAPALAEQYHSWERTIGWKDMRGDPVASRLDRLITDLEARLSKTRP